MCFDFPFVGINDGTFFTGLFVVERFMLSSLSVSDLTEAVPRCFDFRVLFILADLRLGFASFALSESESELDEAADDESVVVDVADETSFFTSGFGFSGVTLAIGFGATPGSGYLRGRPLGRPAVELPDGRRSSFTGCGCGCDDDGGGGGSDGFSSSDSEVLEKILLSFFEFRIDVGAGFLDDATLLLTDLLVADDPAAEVAFD